MKAVVQRVSSAKVEVDGVVTAHAPDPKGGLVALVGLEETDTPEDRMWMADKLVNLRIFPDADGKMNRSLIDTAGTLVIVPNFTVAGDVSRGRRPGFDRAMKPARARDEFVLLVEAARALHPAVGSGVFQAHMVVTIVNDGPVTILLDSRAHKP
ncbi:MAG: D-aminoacyl-tRNA deacylase [Phycisphaerales bacterium]